MIIRQSNSELAPVPELAGSTDRPCPQIHSAWRGSTNRGFEYRKPDHNSSPPTTMSPSHYKQIVLNSRPVADIEPDTFRTESRAFSELKPGQEQALVQCTYLSLDPAMRGYIRDARSYLPPVKIGEVRCDYSLLTLGFG